MDPLVSVIIPTYNRETLIRKAIDSVLAQTYRQWEIVVVDDGSEDNTKDVVLSYKNENIFYIYQENRGIAAARNTGIKNSRGSFIAFLDSDDYWRPNKLEKQMKLFFEHPEYGMVASQCASIRTDGTFRKRNRRGKSGWVLEDLFKANFIRTSSAIVKRECLDKVGLFDETLKEGEEYDLWLRIASKYPIGFVNEPLAVYVDNPYGVSTDSLVGRLYRLQLLQKTYLKEKIPKKVYTKRIANTCHYIGRHYLKRGEKRSGQDYLRKACMLDPFNLKNLLYYVYSYIL